MNGIAPEEQLFVTGFYKTAMQPIKLNFTEQPMELDFNAQPIIELHCSYKLIVSGLYGKYLDRTSKPISCDLC